MRVAVALLCFVSTAHAGQLVDLSLVVPTIRVELRYATANNFTHTRIYAVDARCLVRPEVATRLDKVQRALAKERLGVLVYDCWRPLAAQQKLWAARPDPRYVADPKRGSRHGRGAAVDVTLVDDRGHELEMPTPWDDATARAHRDSVAATPAAIANRARLEAAMEAAGFVGLSTEWWHFDARGWPRYAQLAGDSIVPASTKQLVVVVTPTWDAHEGELTRYQRTSSGWTKVGEGWPVVTGKGLAWGVGVHPSSLAARLGGPTKHEGDRRSPAGIFALTELTGYASHPPPGATLPYRVATPKLYCVDDPRAAEYNRLALAPENRTPAWTSTEPMRRDDALYTRTVFVAHNPGAARGAGSCIFLHVWSDPGRPTVGCTAMALPLLEQLVGWLLQDDAPLLVQLPKSVFDAVPLF